MHILLYIHYHIDKRHLPDGCTIIMWSYQGHNVTEIRLWHNNNFVIVQVQRYNICGCPIIMYEGLRNLYATKKILNTSIILFLVSVDWPWANNTGFASCNNVPFLDSKRKINTPIINKIKSRIADHTKINIAI